MAKVHCLEAIEMPSVDKNTIFNNRHLWIFASWNGNCIGEFSVPQCIESIQVQSANPACEVTNEWKQKHKNHTLFSRGVTARGLSARRNYLFLAPGTLQIMGTVVIGTRPKILITGFAALFTAEL